MYLELLDISDVVSASECLTCGGGICSNEYHICGTICHTINCVFFLFMSTSNFVILFNKNTSAILETLMLLMCRNCNIRKYSLCQPFCPISSPIFLSCLVLKQGDHNLCWTAHHTVLGYNPLLREPRTRHHQCRWNHGSMDCPHYKRHILNNKVCKKLQVL